MQPGDLIADRFEIERLAGAGGMGAVYRARDRLTGEPVALKVLQSPGEMAARFAAEARVLAELEHPHIVRYVAHGATAAGVAWLAMAWLEGEDLAARLAREGLTVHESVTLVARAAGALVLAHRRGVIHRDIKPSNLFLPGGAVERVTVLDFGIARAQHASGATHHALTRTGTVIGTPGYMSPEQARGDRALDARADVYALGCVLYECLTGQPAFAGPHLYALLARILFEEVPRVRELRGDVPPALDALCARMLAKDPRARPADAGELLAALEALGPVGPTRAAPARALRPTLTASEQRLICVVMVADAVDARAGGGSAEVAFDRAATVHAEASEQRAARLRAVVAPFGAALECLADGAAVATLAGTAGGSAIDQAARAARCALALREAVAGAVIALATGRADVSTRFPVGEVIDRAAGLLRRALEPGEGETTPVSDPGGETASVAPRPVRLDEVTAGLLEGRFELGQDAGGPVLRAEPEATEAARTLLGRPSPCVGRERELGQLDALFDECVGDSVARAVLVTAPAGVGKSRLRHEFVRRARQRTAAEAGVEVWIGRGDPLRAGSPFGMIAPAVRRAAGVLDGAPPEARRERLRARVAQRFAPGSDALERVAAFVGEMAGVPFDDGGNVQLRAARRDPQLMADQVVRAWEDWLDAECEAQPVLLVLEDLHWGDLPSLRLVEAALRTLADRPFMVLALGRPEVHDAFPRLRAWPALHEVKLGELSKRASEKLVREVLGPDHADDATVARIVERAAGNAFYLEELIRAAARTGGGAARGDERLPETVLAMVQARLSALDPGARRVLRAASVFGTTFWRGGVLHLLGGAGASGEAVITPGGDAAGDASGAGEWLADLAERELVARRREARFPGETEYAFRHALLREAAYATLTAHDRALGHRLAGEWLARAGEGDAMALAEHFERGGETARASEQYHRAAEAALGGHDLAAAIARAERAVVCGAAGETLGALRLLQAEAHAWRGAPGEASACAQAAMGRLRAGSARWCAAAGVLAEALSRLGAREELAGVAEALCALGWDARAEDAGALGALVTAAARAAPALVRAGLHDAADALVDRVARVEGAAAIARDPVARASVERARALRAARAGDPAGYFACMEAAVASFEAAGDVRAACERRASLGFAYQEFGAYERAERALREAIASAERLGLAAVAASARLNLGRALMAQAGGASGEVRAVLDAARAGFTAQGDARGVAAVDEQLAWLAARAGEWAPAEAAARAAVAGQEGASASGGATAGASGAATVARARALAVLASVLLAGRASERAAVEEARAAASAAMAVLDELGQIQDGEALIRLAYAEALWASGARDEAREVMAAACERLRAAAETVQDAGLRESFMARVPAHARTLARAREWGVE